MALTEEQLALITGLERSNESREDYEPRREKGSVGGAIAVCQFEGLGIPSREDVEAALRELRK